jgi:hypothetical protein
MLKSRMCPESSLKPTPAGPWEDSVVQIASIMFQALEEPREREGTRGNHDLGFDSAVTMIMIMPRRGSS